MLGSVGYLYGFRRKNPVEFHQGTVAIRQCAGYEFLGDRREMPVCVGDKFPDVVKVGKSSGLEYVPEILLPDKEIKGQVLNLHGYSEIVPFDCTVVGCQEFFFKKSPVICDEKLHH